MRSVYRLLKPMLPVTLVLTGLWIAFIIAAPQTFLDTYIYISFMTSIPFIAIAAAGITLVVIAGEMDMSFASNMAMSGFAFAVITRWSGSPVLGLAAALAMGACIGLIACFNQDESYRTMLYRKDRRAYPCANSVDAGYFDLFCGDFASDGAWRRHTVYWG